MKRQEAIGVFVVLLSLFCARLASQDWQARNRVAAGAPLKPEVSIDPLIVSFEVGPDQTLNYPSTLANLPDEHTTFLPLFQWPQGARQTDHDNLLTYLAFGASRVGSSNAGAVILTTTDLAHFDFATALGYVTQPAIAGPVAFTTCDPAYASEFDENYAAPGSVLQDPTMPPGNFIMLYEAENHCPGGVWQPPFYATIGFARSSDSGRTWPAPIDTEFGGPGRHVVLKGPDPEPTSEPSPAPMGDAIPAAFLDWRFLGEGYLYVSYSYYVGPGGHSDGFIRVARAKLGGGVAPWNGWSASTAEDQPVSFVKWYNDSFSQPGIGGLDTGVLPALGCQGRQAQSSIYYADDLGLYFLIYVCDSMAADGQAAWFYSTATSLELQNWSQPQMIANSQFPITSCSGGGEQFDGFYPSLMSPGAAPGHLRLTGLVFFLNGCDTGQPRAFTSRVFRINVEP